MYLNRKETGLYEYKDNNQKVIYTIKLTSGSHNKPWLITDETIDSPIGRTHSLMKAINMIKSKLKKKSNES